MNGPKPQIVRLPGPAERHLGENLDLTGREPVQVRRSRVGGTAAAVIASLPTAARRVLPDSDRVDPHGTLDVKSGLVANGWPNLAIDRVLPYFATHLDGACGPLGQPPPL